MPFGGGDYTEEQTEYEETRTESDPHLGDNLDGSSPDDEGSITTEIGDQKDLFDKDGNLSGP